MGHLYRLDFPNGKSYIGISINVAIRFRGHHYSAVKSDALKYRAWRKHGAPTLKVLAVVENSLLNETERRAIAIYGTKTPGGYNLTDGGEGLLNPSPETRAKMSEAGRNQSPETRTRISASLIGNQNCLGYRHTPDTLAKLSDLKKGRPLSPETRAKMSVVRKGRPQSPEHRANLIAAISGNTYHSCPHTPEARARISASMKGITRSPETRAKIGMAVMKYWANRKIRSNYIIDSTTQ